MPRLYKLTDENWQTYGGMQWGKNVTHTAPGNGDLCSPAYIHAYEHPLIAVFMNPIHAGFSNPVLWVARGDIDKNDNGLKCGTKRLTTLWTMPLPSVSPVHRIAFGILCAMRVYKKKTFIAWAKSWLANSDRSEETAASAANAADAAATIAARANAARANAAYVACYAAANAADYADCAADAAYAATDCSTACVNATANAATNAARGKKTSINFVKLARSAVKIS